MCYVLFKRPDIRIYRALKQMYGQQAAPASMPWSHRSMRLMGIKLLAAVLSTFFLWNRPTTVPWVVKMGCPEAAAPSMAAATVAPAGARAVGAGTARQRVLQVCVRDGGFYEGKWVQRPHAWRPHAHYAHGLAGKHKFFDGG